MDDDVQRFDRWSKTYEASWAQRFFDAVHRAMFDLIAEDPAFAPETILDVGCGTGRLLRKAAERWPAAKLTGIDAAEGMITVARSLMPGIVFHQCFAESLPLGDATVDLAMSSVSMHHWRDGGAGVSEVARVLRIGGLFCLADMAPAPWLAKLGRSKARNRRAINGLLTGAGFRIRRQRGMMAGFVAVSLAIK